MSHNHDFKANFLTIQNIDNTSYDIAGHVRNVCFAWQNGRKMFFNYAYLVSVELDIQDVENCITVSFTSHTIFLHGYRLAVLFELFMSHIPKLVAETPIRYTVSSSQEPFVTKISVKK